MPDFGGMTDEERVQHNAVMESLIEVVRPVAVEVECPHRTELTYITYFEDGSVNGYGPFMCECSSPFIIHKMLRPYVPAPDLTDPGAVRLWVDDA